MHPALHRGAWVRGIHHVLSVGLAPETEGEHADNLAAHALDRKGALGARANLLDFSLAEQGVEVLAVLVQVLVSRLIARGHASALARELTTNAAEYPRVASKSASRFGYEHAVSTDLVQRQRQAWPIAMVNGPADLEIEGDAE